MSYAKKFDCHSSHALPFLCISEPPSQTTDPPFFNPQKVGRLCCTLTLIRAYVLPKYDDKVTFREVYVENIVQEWSPFQCTANLLNLHLCCVQYDLEQDRVHLLQKVERLTKKLSLFSCRVSHKKA